MQCSINERQLSRHMESFDLSMKDRLIKYDHASASASGPSALCNCKPSIISQTSFTISTNLLVDSQKKRRNNSHRNKWTSVAVMQLSHKYIFICLCRNRCGKSSWRIVSPIGYRLENLSRLGAVKVLSKPVQVSSQSLGGGIK